MVITPASRRCSTGRRIAKSKYAPRLPARWLGSQSALKAAFTFLRGCSPKALGIGKSRFVRNELTLSILVFRSIGSTRACGRALPVQADVDCTKKLNKTMM